MLTHLAMKLRYRHDEKLSYQISSLMHGILMEHISPEYGEVLHQDGIKPFTQYITQMKEDSFIWNITTMTKEAKTKIINQLTSKETFYMKHKNLTLVVEEINLTGIQNQELVEQYYFNEQSRYITVRFLSPTAFKSFGKYVFIPDVRRFFQSLMNKYNTVTEHNKIEGRDVLDHFEENISINRYQLRSVQFALEGVRIPAFLGTVTFKINGPQQMVNLANMLVKFGTYSGVGIKASLGMGAIEIVERMR